MHTSIGGGGKRERNTRYYHSSRRSAALPSSLNEVNSSRQFSFCSFMDVDRRIVFCLVSLSLSLPVCLSVCLVLSINAQREKCSPPPYLLLLLLLGFVALKMDGADRKKRAKSPLVVVRIIIISVVIRFLSLFSLFFFRMPFPSSSSAICPSLVSTVDRLFLSSRKVP